MGSSLDNLGQNQNKTMLRSAVFHKMWHCWDIFSAPLNRSLISELAVCQHTHYVSSCHCNQVGFLILSGYYPERVVSIIQRTVERLGGWVPVSQLNQTDSPLTSYSTKITARFLWQFDFWKVPSAIQWRAASRDCVNYQIRRAVSSPSQRPTQSLCRPLLLMGKAGW